MNILKFLLSTTLVMMSYNNIYASEGSKTMYYNMLTSSYENLKDYKINEIKKIDDKSNPGTNIPNPLYGAIYDERTDGNYYLVDENKNKFFDLQTIINIIIIKEDNTKNLNSPYGNSMETPNLIVKSFNDEENNTYIMTATSETTVNIWKKVNLIIPQNTTLDYKNVMLYFNLGDEYSNILILGTITNSSQNIIPGFLLFVQAPNYVNVILGPQATFCYNYKEGYVSLIPYASDNMRYVLYPGCTLKTNNIYIKKIK